MSDSITPEQPARELLNVCKPVVFGAKVSEGNIAAEGVKRGDAVLKLGDRPKGIVDFKRQIIFNELKLASGRLCGGWAVRGQSSSLPHHPGPREEGMCFSVVAGHCEVARDRGIVSMCTQC